MKKILSIAILSSLSTLAAAESYQTFGELGYAKADVSGAKATIALSGQYYFTAQDTVGPLDQLSYLDDTSNVRAIFSTSDGDSLKSIGGSFYGGKFGAGIDFEDNDGTTATRVDLNYFITDKVKASLAMRMPEESDDVLTATLQYDHAINDTDYVGFTLNLDDAKDSTVKLSSKYLNSLENGHFVVVEAGYSDSDVLTTLDLSAKWYINKNTGFLLGFQNSEVGSVGSLDTSTTSIGVTHFFSNNVSIDATYYELDSDFLDASAIQVAASVQF